MAEVMPSISNSSMGLDSADVNNDGRIDFLVADMAATTPEKDLRGMVNRRINGKEPLDRPEALRQYPANTLLLNTGTGRFIETAHLAGVARTDWTWSVLFNDLDHDGRVDLHVTNGIFRELHNIDLVARSARAGSRAEQLALLKRCPLYNEPNLFFLNRGEGRFEEAAAAAGLDDVGISFGAAMGDLDADRDLDLVYLQFRKPPAVYRNDFAQGRSIVLDLRSPGNNRYAIGARVVLASRSGKQVRELQQARGYLSTSEPIVHFGLPAGDGEADVEVQWPSGRRQRIGAVAAGSRIRVDEDPEAARSPARPAGMAPTWLREVSGPAGMQVRRRESPTLELIRQPLAPSVFNRAGPALAAADLNRDGLEDFALGATTRDPGIVFLSNGRGGYVQVPFDEGAPINRGALVAADFDRDGAVELLVLPGGNTAGPGDAAYRAALWRLDGADQLKRTTGKLIPELNGPVGGIAVADFDRDGWLDVVLGGRVVPGRFPEAPPAMLWKGGPAGFADVHDAGGLGIALDAAPGAARTLGLVTCLLASDVDGDGWPDLLLAREWGTLGYWRNREGRGFEDQTAASGLEAIGVGLWHSLCAGDFDGDGHMDYVAGNMGTNTSIAAMPGETATLYHGQFAGSAAPQVVEAVVHGGREWPRRGLTTLGGVFRDLPRRFPANDRFAAAGLTAVFTESDLARAVRWELREKRSGVLRRRADGTFLFEALPWQAQVSPLQGMLASDVNGDGLLDLVATQNSFDPVPEHGRADAGLGVILLGDGRGAFTFVDWAQSGWIVPGDARALTTGDFDRNGWPDFFVTRNNRETMLFLHQIEGPARRWRITLEPERPGDGFPWGARVTLELRDRRRQGIEVYPVTSRNSQSIPYVFVASDAHNPVAEVEVRWPSGARSMHRPAGWGGGTLHLRPDGSLRTGL